MNDIEQRVAAALRAARFFDEGPDAQDAVDLIAALASQGLAITEAPDTAEHVHSWLDGECIVGGHVAPPSSVDGEGLRAALERIAAVFHFDGSHNAGGGPPTFRDCADDNCRVATKALAASGSAPSAAEKGR